MNALLTFTDSKQAQAELVASGPMPVTLTNSDGSAFQGIQPGVVAVDAQAAGTHTATVTLGGVAYKILLVAG